MRTLDPPMLVHMIWRMVLVPSAGPAESGDAVQASTQCIWLVVGTPAVDLAGVSAASELSAIAAATCFNVEPIISLPYV